MNTPKATTSAWEEEFDTKWPNLVTFVPMLGQGDARSKVKEFIRKVEADARKEGLEEAIEDFRKWGPNALFDRKEIVKMLQARIKNI